MENLPTARFRKLNDAFQCEHCGREVPAAKRTCRNHCPYCLHSKHVDLMPGDRANPCLGLLRPIGYELSGKKGLVLLFECQSCRERCRNIALTDDPFAADDYQRILSLSHKS